METATARLSSMTGEGDDLGELGVEDDDAVPIGLRWRAGAGVAGGDLGLEEIGAAGGVDLVGAFDGSEAAMDEELIPVGAVLIEEQDGFAGGGDAGAGAGGLDFHERDQAVDLGFGRA